MIQQAGLTRNENDASKLAEAVLCHPAVSNGKTCTTAIRKEELIRLLGDLAVDILESKSAGTSENKAAGRQETSPGE